MIYDPKDDAEKSYLAAIEAKRQRGDANSALVCQRVENAMCTCGAHGTNEDHEEWCDWLKVGYCPDCERYETNLIFLDVEKCSKCFSLLEFDL